MPELPEVEYAAGIARAASAGKTLVNVRALHPSQRRGLPDPVADTLVGETVVDVRRRGKQQLFVLGSGRTIRVHFRMTGDWWVGEAVRPLASSIRVVFDFADGSRLALADSRALSVVSVLEAGVDPSPELGPEATADTFNADWLATRLAGRRIAIKVALLDQALVAGIGNIYASEALWYAHVDPRASSARLGEPALAAVTTGVKRALAKALAHPERYYGANGVSEAVRFNVYDREGKGCRRCRTPIERIVQGARSSYFCPGCQRITR